MKTHFAQRVNVPLTPKSSKVSGDIERRRNEVQNEINVRRVYINQEVFKKDDNAKELVKLAKKTCSKVISAEFLEIITSSILSTNYRVGNVHLNLVSEVQ